MGLGHRSRGRRGGNEEGKPLAMASTEISSAVTFLCQAMKGLSEHPKIPLALERLMIDRWAGHWHPEDPEKGSGYRCITITDGRLDPILREACDQAGVAIDTLDTLPQDFALWTDPGSVSVRMGTAGPIWPLEQFVSVESNGSPDMGHSHSRTGQRQRQRALDPWAKEWEPPSSSESSSVASSP
eukprot:m.416387 g.416387  ORF g.416387 m.416387 type:complete len:184 (-) comp29967_c0_seq1:204-755(-)